MPRSPALLPRAGRARQAPVALLTLAALALAAGAFAPAHASTDANAGTEASAYATFVPKANPNRDGIDYSIWNEAMQNIVISMGPNLRQSAGSPPSGYGTRRIYGHTSRYRLEGTRVMFSFLDDDAIASFGEYRRDLEATADKIDIQALARNEQLAYWINLHNVALVEQIANTWPVRQPREIMIEGVPLDEAKFITVEGVALSPRDIREKIVYANWRDPMVIYGFWRGEIGGPSLQREAFTAENVARLLDRGAREFVNSLRGTQKLGEALQVSELYAEVAPYYFPDFEADLRAHLAQYAQEDVAEILARTTRTEATVKEYDIADLSGGVREPTYSFVTIDGQAQRFRIPRAMGALLAQREEKLRRIIEDGRTGTVTVTPVELPITLPGDAGKGDEGSGDGRDPGEVD